MERQYTTGAKVMAFIGGFGAWFAVLLQLYLMLKNPLAPVFPTLVKFFSFFTILTNILAACCYTTLLMKPFPGRERFLSRSGTLTAVAVYILVVGIVYNTMLRHIWEPQGMQKVADELLHAFNPAFFLLFWIIFVSKEKLEWKAPLFWLIFPLIYLVYTLLRGMVVHEYPYPFVDVNKLGYAKVLLTSGILCIGFLLLSWIFVGLGRATSKK